MLTVLEAKFVLEMTPRVCMAFKTRFTKDKTGSNTQEISNQFQRPRVFLQISWSLGSDSVSRRVDNGKAQASVTLQLLLLVVLVSCA